MAAEPSSGFNRLVRIDLFFVGYDAIEEGRWGQLLVVSDNDHLFRACDESKCVFRTDLARFVNYEKVEFDRIGRQKLSDRDWAH